MILVFTAGNAIFFFMAWEAMAVISYFLVVFESEHKENQRAGLIYIVMTHIGTAFLIVAFMLMFKYTNSFDMFGTSEQIPSVVKDWMFPIIPDRIWYESGSDTITYLATSRTSCSAWQYFCINVWYYDQNGYIWAYTFFALLSKYTTYLVGCFYIMHWNCFRCAGGCLCINGA